MKAARADNIFLGDFYAGAFTCWQLEARASRIDFGLQFLVIHCRENFDNFEGEDLTSTNLKKHCRNGSPGGKIRHSSS